MDAVKVGKKISTLRKAKGMTQLELAEKLHVTNRAVSKWENGLNFPDLGIMEPLALALDITVSELLGLEDRTPEEVFELATGLSEEEKEKQNKRIKDRAWYILLCGCYIVFWAITTIVAPEWTTQNLQQISCVWGIGIIIGAIEILIRFRKLNKK